MKFPEYIPDQFYEELTRKILDSYQSRSYSKQELLNKYLPRTPNREIPKRNWSIYNAGQTKEKVLFLKILNDVIEYIREEQKPVENGRPPKDKYDIIKALCIKTFSNLSNRRVISELTIAKSLGYLDNVPHFNTLKNYLSDENLSYELHKIYSLLAEPLKEVESHFSVDATGFSQPFKKRWVEVRLDKGEHRSYRKLHAICGVRTNIICKAIVTEGIRSDNPYFEDLLKDTAKIFNVNEVSADAGYLSRKNCQVVEDIGAKPYIMPKKNVKSHSLGYPAWNRMLWLWKSNKEMFKHFYHLRSNVESTFSAVKRKYGGAVRSKNNVGQDNEILCKVICFNASILIRCLLQFDIDLKWLESEQKHNKFSSIK